jgi:F-type H+-transporting ATPase subunit delta
MKKISERVANRYARALASKYLSQNGQPAIGELESVSIALNVIAAALEQNKSLVRVLGNPAVNLVSRQAVIADLANKVRLGDAQFNNFLALLVENKRILGLSEVSEVFATLVAELKKMLKIKIVSASTVDSTEQERVKATLEKEVGHAVQISWELDNSLMGGAIVRMGDRQLDGSVRGRLERMRAQLFAGN